MTKRMIDKKKIARYNTEMAEHANGVAQYLSNLICGRFATQEQVHDMADYVFDAEIRCREHLTNLLRLQMG